MRTLQPFSSDGNKALIATYAHNMAEAVAVRRAEMAAQLARAEAEATIKTRSQFLANMNHELRTPLNAIIGFASMLRDTDTYNLDAEKRQGYADYILQSADLLLDHINTLLESATLDSGEMQLERTEIDFRALLTGALERVKIAAKAAQVSIEVKMTDQPVMGWGDEQRLGQALDHLLRAAVRQSPAGEKILLRTIIDDKGWAEIGIRDRSPGMTAEAVSHALNAFRDVNRGLDRSFEGPGVGFAIAKTFVEMQGGRFNLKSRPGEGTLVRISAPPPSAKPQSKPTNQSRSEEKEVRLAG